MFESLSDKFSSLFDKLSGTKTITQAQLDEALRAIRLALLEADVALAFVREFTAQIAQEALGQEVIKSVRPRDMVIKIVHDALHQALKHPKDHLNLSVKPAFVMVCGLQGTGKTTSIAKLAQYLHKQGKKVLLASCDMQRLAAQDQLKILADRLNLPFVQAADTNVLLHAQQIKTQALAGSYDVVLLDTAGRLAVDESLMSELSELQNLIKPQETVFIADAMMGQNALKTVQSFQDFVSLTSLILTRLDGDARGGALISLRHATNLPVLFVGTGEGLDDLQAFDPERMAGRILGMGDIVSLVEQAAEKMDAKVQEKLLKKMDEGRFDFTDLADQIRQVQKMGGLGGLMSFMPGAQKMKAAMQSKGMDDRTLSRQLAIIGSMTAQERKNPDLLKVGRKKRIAQGAGVSISDVEKLIKKFYEAQKMVKSIHKMGGIKALSSQLSQLKDHGHS